jgi:ribosome silencing factor RsfS/YbeB/iojap
MRLLRRRFPRTRFVWLCGADILTQLPRWRRWREIVDQLAFAVLPRPGYTRQALAGRIAHRLRASRRPARLARLIPGVAPAWVFLPHRQLDLSSTALRAASAPPAISQGADPIAKPPKPPASPSRHQPAPRKRAAKPTLPDAATAPGSPRKKTLAAGPRQPAARARKPKAPPTELDRMQAAIVASLDDDKAENIVTLDLTGRALFCDRMVIATGLADRQITAMAQHLKEKLHEAGLRRVQIEGAGGSDWVLIDAGDIVVHLFKPEARETYALEKMWGTELDETG